MKRGLILICIQLSFISAYAKSNDHFQWLEEISTDQSMGWVTQNNKVTTNKFTQTKEFQKTYNDILTMLESEDKLLYPQIIGDHVYNFWRDKKHVKGVWRRQPIQSFEKGKRKWEIVIDFDALAKAENKNWVFKGETCLKPQERYCLISLSDGGKDAVELREFDLATKSFVAGGFVIPEAKTRVEWRDKDALYIATDLGPNTHTQSGYPRILKILKRGETLQQAKTLLETQPQNMLITAYRLQHKNDIRDIAIEALNFYDSNYYLVENLENKIKTQKIQFPKSIRVYGYYEGYFLTYLLKDSKLKQKQFVQGTVVAVKVLPNGQLEDVQEIFAPEMFGQSYSKKSFGRMLVAKDKIIFLYTDDLDEKLSEVELVKKEQKSTFKITDINLQGFSSAVSLRLIDARKDTDKFYFTAENMNLPTGLYVYDFGVHKKSQVQASKRFYKDKNIKIEKRFATSKDGTKVPYFLVYDGKLKLNSQNKVLISGYGGFNIPRKLTYSPILGKHWLNKNNVYVLANIRGGGEYGPGWHQAAILQNKQKSYEDFTAVTEDVVHQKISSPSKIAIMGGSNGGLLVGAVSMQRPDLYGAVVSLVPLLDMSRYHKLLAGASWMSEYGNPDKAQDWQFIKKYSPYHNVSKDTKYPHFLFYTSTKDDRVHPAHARKMVAKMKELDIADVYLYENTEGGHGGSSDLKEAAHQWALIFAFLQEGLN
ncbi:MAG: prolyl oligopeptidase family serine peptidase [Bdellovibrionaceae bacterium]|nr:prolyl oligopeptidase family serine peptidase [Pseudobdellovibrionaceae bacterium]